MNISQELPVPAKYSLVEVNLPLTQPLVGNFLEFLEPPVDLGFRRKSSMAKKVRVPKC
jgi:hypothetical protein